MYKNYLYSWLCLIVTSFIIINFAICKNSENWPKSVLITNDNGLKDIKIIELAKAFSKIAKTYVVAPLEDQSGTSSYLGATRSGKIEVERIEISNDIEAYAVDGYPADCIVLALTGIMKDNPPDLIVSGINGGPNLGTDWFGSGTIGAARIASFGGFRAIAVSGLKSDIPGSIEAATNWVVRLAQSAIVQELKPPQYLTISIPRIPPKDILGIQIANRSDILEIPIFGKVVDENKNNTREVWKIEGVKESIISPSKNTDLSLYEEGYIVIVPMLVNEIDYSSMDSLRQQIDKIPNWEK